MRAWKFHDVTDEWGYILLDIHITLFKFQSCYLIIEDRAMKKLHLVVTIVATASTMLLILGLHRLSYLLAAPLKENFYTRNFTDSRALVSLDVIIYYETELDGTWQVWYGASAGNPAYNVTVLVKPTFINTTAVSMLRVIEGLINGGQVADVPGTCHPADSAPLDWGMDMMPLWINNSTWVAQSERVTSWSRTTLNFYNLDYVPLEYHFVLRLIRTDGTREIFVADDTIRIPITSSAK